MFLKKVIVLVRSIEEPMWEETTKQKTNKEAKKIYETKKKYCHDLSIFAGVLSSRISPDCLCWTRSKRREG